MENSKHLDIIEKSLHEICQEEVLDNELSIKLISVLELFDIAKDINRKQLQLAYTRGKNDVLQEIVNRSFTTSPESDPPKKEWNNQQQLIRSILKTNLAYYNFPSRLYNCLRESDIITIGDLVQQTEYSLSKIRNIGDDSLQRLKSIVDVLDLSFGMNVKKYRLHED